ncbi:MAG: flap endonuclease [Solirubrobacterales bacterium]|nr:flap endonuclease [Solirubrobacterales bacterium]
MTIPRVPCDWLLLDGSSLIFRAFYGAQRRVEDAEALRTAAIGGFLFRLARLIVERRPARIAVADDADWRPQWRVEQLSSYKEHRTGEPVPPGLVPQIPVIDGFLRAIGIDVIGVPGYEAEDVIAALAGQMSGTVEIASGDRDLFALVEDPRVRVLYPEKSGLSVIDEAEITRRYAIPGRRYADFAILRGDPSDGLPGLRGVGAVSAAAMIRRHGDIAGVLRERELRPADREYLERAACIVPPVGDLPIEPPAGRREAYPADPAALEAFLERYGLRDPAEELLAALGTSSYKASRST